MAPEEINRLVGKRLADRRRELRLSLAQVSQRCGVSLQQIHKYETGQTALSAPMLVQLARCLDVSAGYFLQDFACEHPSTSSAQNGRIGLLTFPTRLDGADPQAKIRPLPVWIAGKGMSQSEAFLNHGAAVLNSFAAG